LSSSASSFHGSDHSSQTNINSIQTLSISCIYFIFCYGVVHKGTKKLLIRQVLAPRCVNVLHDEWLVYVCGQRDSSSQKAMDLTWTNYYVWRLQYCLNNKTKVKLVGVSNKTIFLLGCKLKLLFLQNYLQSQ